MNEARFPWSHVDTGFTRGSIWRCQGVGPLGLGYRCGLRFFRVLHDVHKRDCFDIIRCHGVR